MIYRYYTLFRPPMLGAVPRGMIEIEDYGTRRMVPSVGREAWGHVDYVRPLSERDVYSYELAADPRNPLDKITCE